MSRSASKIRDNRFTYSVKKDAAFAKSRRSLSVDCRSRGSYVPDKKRPSSEDRQSGGKLNVRWVPRKSSINLQDIKRKDTRPLTDKAYQKRRTSDLVEFLKENKFTTTTITTSKLMNPSKKDFEVIFQHLYNCFDPKYQVKKIEEEAPKILKSIGYPFTLNKSAFVYVARTNWPNLLGVLIWLMDLLKFAHHITADLVFEACQDSSRADIHSILLRYICSRYRARIDNREEEIAEFESIIKSKFAPNFDELLRLNEETKLKLAAEEEKINSMQKLAESNAELDKNIADHEVFISQMESHYQIKKDICDHLEEDLKEKESEGKALQEQVSKLQDAYDAQGFDGKKHLNYFESQKKDLADKLERKRALFKEVQDKFHDSQIKSRKRRSEVVDSSQSIGNEYSDLIDSLKNILEPISAIKNPQVQKLCSTFQLEFPTWEVYLNKHSIQSIKSFRSSLENVTEKLKRTGELLKRVLDSMNQKQNELDVKLSEVSMKLQLLSIQERKQEQELNSKKKRADDEISSIHIQSKKLNDTTSNLKDKKSALEKTYREMIAEKEILIEFRKNKENELNDYYNYQKELFEYFDRSEKETLLLMESHGNEMAENFKELEDL